MNENDKWTIRKEVKGNDETSAIAQEIVNAIKKSLTKIIFDLLARDKDKI